MDIGLDPKKLLPRYRVTTKTSGGAAIFSSDRENESIRPVVSRKGPRRIWLPHSSARPEFRRTSVEQTVSAPTSPCRGTGYRWLSWTRCPLGDVTGVSVNLTRRAGLPRNAARTSSDPGISRLIPPLRDRFASALELPPPRFVPLASLILPGWMMQERVSRSIDWITAPQTPRPLRQVTPHWNGESIALQTGQVSIGYVIQYNMCSLTWLQINFH